MGKPNRTPQPPNVASTTFTIDITVPNKFIPLILSAVPGEESTGSRVAAMAEGALLDLCEGGIMLQSPVIKKLNEAFGASVEVEDIVGQFQRGVGRKDGKLQITISLDPAYEGIAQQAADFQGVDIPRVMQNAWDTAWDNGDFYDPRGRVGRVVMPAESKAELVKILGKDFSTGTELAGLIKAYAIEHEGLFSEVDK